MNRHTDIDRTLEVFFLDGPGQMPDRLFEAVLDQVERVPQRRLTRLKLRFTDMTTTARWVAAGAAAVLVVGVGFAALGRGPTDVPGATPSPSISSSPSGPAADDVPEILRHPMLGELRTGPSAPAGQDRSIIEFSANRFVYNGSTLQSVASAAGQNEIRVVSGATSTGCAPDDEGAYTWTATAAGTRVAFTLVADECAARAAVIPGSWLRSDCENTENYCLGPLAASSYQSFFMDPFVPHGDPWRPRFGAITYDVPEGWANVGDWPTEYTLVPTSAGADTGIYVRSDVVASSTTDVCAEAADPAVGQTAADLVEHLVSLPGVAAGDPVDVSIGGLPGFRVDTYRDPAWTQTCPFSNGEPYRLLYVDRDDEEGFAWGLEENTRMRQYLLDLGDGRALLITIEAPTEAEYEAIIDEATAIVESMTFSR